MTFRCEDPAARCRRRKRKQLIEAAITIPLMLLWLAWLVWSAKH